MKLVLFISLLLASIAMAQGLIWSEPVRFDYFGGASLPSIICDKYGRLWAARVGGAHLRAIEHGRNTLKTAFGITPGRFGRGSDTTPIVWERKPTARFGFLTTTVVG